MASTPVPVLELDNVCAGYKRTAVLRETSVSVPLRSIVAVLGPNGAGKTTMLRVASGLLTPTSGAVRLHGQDVTSAPPHRRAAAGLCLIPEGRGIFRSLTVAENIALHTPPRVREQRISKATDAFPALRDRLKHVAGNLSGGQQQMLALARIYLCEPRVVLLDEISSGLAPMIVSEIFDTLSELATGGISLVLVEQYVSRALEMADHVYMLNRGRIVFSGPPGELDEHSVLREYLGTDLENPG
jgi:branched-chain amino acid transport system ATP-binding protein